MIRDDVRIAEQTRHVRTGGGTGRGGGRKAGGRKEVGGVTYLLDRAAIDLKLIIKAREATLRHTRHAMHAQ